jgi:peptide/nickel transport system substrate-binding protein
VQTLALLDPATGGVIGQVEVDAPITRIAVGDDSIWVSSEVAGTLVRVDPVLRAVRQTIPVGGGASGIAFGDGAVWVTTSANRSVARVDPDTNEVVQRVTTGNAPTDVAMAAGSLWVTNRLDGTVSQIDPESGKQLRAIAVGTSPVAIAGDDSALWVADSWEGTVVRLDPRTGAVTATINVGNGPSAIAAGEAVWVANAVDGTVSQISPASNAVVSTVSVGGNPSGVVAVEGGAWVTTDVDGIVRVDSRTGQVQRRLATDSRPVSVAAADSSVWTGVAPAGDAHRGGTLRIVSDLDADSVDPAAASEGEALTIQGLLYDGLIGPKRTGGPSSLELVPNLATSLPHPVDGGKTYTFQLRRGVRYSTGDPVRPADFRHAIERAFAIQPAAADAFGSIRGADTCRKQPGACDLSDGIVADDTQSTVTFHLTRPDSEFLYGLASTAAAAVPSDTPRRQMESVPSTGAYMVESFSHHDRIVLTRNPYFRAWSAPARPSGYVDRIEWRMGVDLDEAVELVADGEADWFDSVQPELPLDRLRIYNAGQLHVYPRPATYSMFLNTRAAPFDDIAVRRALNFAVDRAEGVRLLGGPDEATVTCQIHPPNHPNYVPYCPYTGGATNSGRWEQPDLEQAKRLIAASKTRGTKVEVWALAPLFGKVGRYFVGLLDDLGYDATLHIERDPSRYFETVAEADREVQIGAVGWFLGGSPSPSGLFTIYTCASFDRDPLRNLNFSGLCSPRVDRLVRRARAAQTLSPARAAPLWREVERVLVDLAPSVPLANPNAVDFVSGRVGNYRSSPALQLLPDQVWVQ